MISITKQFRTETGHRLLNYDGPCAHLHGHSYLWEITVMGPVDNRGMIVDFKDLKKVLKGSIGTMDHAMLLHKEDPLALFLSRAHATNGEVHRVILFDFNPTAENIVASMSLEIKEKLYSLNEDIALTKIKLWETANSYAVWEI